MNVTRRSSAFGALAAIAAFATGCSEVAPTEAHVDHESASFAHNSSAGVAKGTTAGWFRGRTVTFFYNKNFDCVLPAEAQFSEELVSSTPAQSNCVLAAEATRSPRGGNDPVVYVLVPLFDDTQGITLHCPVAGECINHPNDLDASRVFGPDAAAIPLPPHSHVVDKQRGGWWKVEVNGVSTRAAWDAIERAKSLASVRQQQELGTVTADLDTNLFLFFSVRP
jgi:hypothetical protein